MTGLRASPVYSKLGHTESDGIRCSIENGKRVCYCIEKEGGMASKAKSVHIFQFKGDGITPAIIFAIFFAKSTKKIEFARLTKT